MSNSPKNIPSEVEAHEKDGYVAETHCACCGRGRELVGKLSRISTVSPEYCMNCLRKAAHGALHAKPFRPVEIAGNVVPLKAVSSHHLFWPGPLSEHTMKLRVFDAPAPRIYCSHEKCGVFILHDTGKLLRTSLKCPKCSKVTCTSCHRKSHPPSLRRCCFNY